MPIVFMLIVGAACFLSGGLVVKFHQTHNGLDLFGAIMYGACGLYGLTAAGAAIRAWKRRDWKRQAREKEAVKG